MTTNYQTLSSLIHFKCNIMREMITNLETQLLEKSKEFNLMESVSILLNGEYKYLINENIDELLKNINNFHLPDL